MSHCHPFLRTYTVDGPLGRWEHAELRPPELAGVVDFLWHFEGRTSFPRERNFPSGKLELIVHLGERYFDVRGEERVRCPLVCVTGLQTSPLVIEAPDAVARVMGLRLHALGAYVLLGRPLDALSGLTVDLVDVVGPSALELAERCSAAGNATERLRIAADWIAGRVARRLAPDPAIAWIARGIERRQGAVSISALRERTGLSKTRLAAAFRQQVGVTPKLYARIHRFRRVLDELHGGARDLADLAHAAGYYDQPHLNAEFRQLAGLTPSAFLAVMHYPGSPSLPEDGLPQHGHPAASSTG